MTRDRSHECNTLNEPFESLNRWRYFNKTIKLGSSLYTISFWWRSNQETRRLSHNVANYVDKILSKTNWYHVKNTRYALRGFWFDICPYDSPLIKYDNSLSALNELLYFLYLTFIFQNYLIFLFLQKEVDGWNFIQHNIVEGTSK